MESQTPAATTDAQLALTSEELDSIAESSKPFIGTWNSLISQTNWEKGKIIFEWRSRLQDSGVATQLYSDPAWSRLVGEVTPQHVGRLRRTWERFGDVFTDYEGLYWSHFLAALDWEDAEMWLEGAVQNDWSVSGMRYQRWETLGKLKDDEPRPEDIVSSSGEEGVGAIASTEDSGETVYSGDAPSIQGPLREGPDFGDEPDRQDAPDSAETGTDESVSVGDRVQIDSILEGLPAELSGPFRQFRAAVVAARDDDWQTVKRIDVIALINDLKLLLRKVPASTTDSETS